MSVDIHKNFRSRKGGLQERRDSGLERFRTGGIQEKRDTGKEGYRKREIQERRDSGLEGFRTAPRFLKKLARGLFIWGKMA